MSKKQKATDPSRFEGNGISYRAKLIGFEDVAEARGDKMCQETIQKLKGAVKSSGQHKQRVFINVTLEGLKIIDGVSQNVLHTHPVHQISFISRDVTDSRAFGYVFASADGSHKFFGIKTASSAENVVLALRDLFQTVYEMKKQEMEEAKAKAAGSTDVPAEEKDTTEAVADVKTDENEESVEQGIEQIKNLDFEDPTSDEGAGQPFSTVTSSVSTAAPAAATLTDPWGLPASAEPSAELPKTSSSSSALSDLEQLSSPPPSSNPFGGMPAFPAAPASSSAAFFGLGQSAMTQSGMNQPGMTQPSIVLPGMTQPGMAQPGMAQPGMTQPGMAQSGMIQTGMAQSNMPFGQQGMMGPNVGLPVTKDPFGDPFNTSQAQQQMQASQMMGSSGGPFGVQPAFGSPFPAAPAQPFPGSSTAPGTGGMQPAFGRASPSFTPFGTAAPAAGMGLPMGPQGGAVADPFLVSGDNFLQPSKSEGQEQKGRPVSPGHANLFDDLVDIKKAGGAETATKSPREMFQLSQPAKKSLNEMKEGAGDGTPQASVVFDQDPFTEDPFGSIDTMLNTLASSDTDPFGTPHLPSSSPPPLPPLSLPHPPPAPPDPSPPESGLALSAPSSKESSPETRFDVPDEPPPPLPPHLKLSSAVAAPSPPPRPPPIPNRPMPKTQKNSPAKSVSRSFSTPPPLPTTPRPSSSIASSSPASELSTSDAAPSAVEGFKDAQFFRNTSAQSSPRVSHPPPSPSHSWGSSGSLSHSSSQKSLERAAITTDSDDPFGVPLRSKRSFSSADGASKRSSRSSGKLSVKSDSKVSVTVDPFGVPFKDRTNSSERTGGNKTDMDNPFSVPEFSDSGSVASSSGPWKAFGDHAGNGVTDTKKPVAMASNGQRTNSSPFGDSFFPTPVNGKPSDAQS